MNLLVSTFHISVVLVSDQWLGTLILLRHYMLGSGMFGGQISEF